MFCIGKKLVLLFGGVFVIVLGQIIEVKGLKGMCFFIVIDDVIIIVEENVVFVILCGLNKCVC